MGVVRKLSLPVLPTPADGPGILAGTAHERSAEPGEGSPRIALVTLGCDKNTVDSERLMAGLLGAGAASVERAEDADVVVLNTCGFIDVAKEESVDAILAAARLKAEGRVRAVVAMGCLVQRYKEELEQEIPEVDLFLGLTEAARLVPELRARGLLPSGGMSIMERPLRAVSGSGLRHTSFLKISEGCDHTCAFCAIPLMRGRFRSTPADVLVAEARELESRGVVELNLVSQDTTWYGRDWRRAAARPSGAGFFVGREFARMAGPRAGAVAGQASRGATGSGIVRGAAPDAAGDLAGLLRMLLDATSIRWLRLFYMYPSGISRELVALMAREPRIVPYLDMPIQHGADEMLRRMRRPERQATIRERVQWLRAAVPDIALRTTVVVGFPGETEREFETLLELLEEVRFDRVGGFTYSPEEGTPAAAMEQQVPESVRRERLERLMELQRGVTLERNETWIGRDVAVLVDRSEDGVATDAAVGRTAAQAAEVDGLVHLRGVGGSRPGDFVVAHIVDADEDDLYGVVNGTGGVREGD